MAVWDIVILAISVAGALIGFRRGFLRSLGAIAAVIVAIFVCRSVVSFTSVAANIAVFIVVYLTVRMLASLLRVLSKMMMLGPLDRVCGAAFVAFEYLLGVSMMLNLWVNFRTWLSPEYEPSFTESRIVEPVMKLYPKITGYILNPDNTRNVIKEPELQNQV